MLQIILTFNNIIVLMVFCFFVLFFYLFFKLYFIDISMERECVDMGNTLRASWMYLCSKQQNTEGCLNDICNVSYLISTS